MTTFKKPYASLEEQSYNEPIKDQKEEERKKRLKQLK